VPPTFPVSRAELPSGVLPFSAPPRPFSNACSPPPSFFFARDCAHAGGPVR
jgi:hypothetical protein